MFNNFQFERWPGQMPSKTGATLGAVSQNWDGNGKIDLLVTREDGVFFYRNCSNEFKETKLDIKLNDKSNPATITLGDVNKDGHTDIFLATYLKKELMEGQTIFNKKNYGATSVLLINNGDNSLSDMTESYGLNYIHNTFQGLFADIDDDSWLDLIVAYDTGEPKTYRNVEGEKFIPVNNPMTGKFGYPMGIAAGDINNDNKLDLFFSNTGSSVPKFMAKGDFTGDQTLVTEWLLFKNEGDFRFSETGKEINLTDFEFSWGCVFEDFNLDGLQDLAVAENYISFPPHSLFPLPCRLLIQLPSGKFASVEEQASAVNKNFAITPLVSDFNNDGYPDLLYININGKSKAFINKRGNAEFIKVKLPNTNESIGAKITVIFSDSTSSTNWNLIGEGLSSDQSNSPIFAITPGNIVTEIIVKFNSNRIDTIRNIKPNSTYNLNNFNHQYPVVR